MKAIVAAMCILAGYAGGEIMGAESKGGAAGLRKVKMETTMGEIVLELDSIKAPRTVANFLEYVRSGFYNGTIFHRVIKSFMIQGGGFTPEMVQKETRAPVPNEADNGLKNIRGTIAMARRADPHSATSQFFINTVDNPGLDHRNKTPEGWGYCVFGRVVSGMATVDSIASVRTSSAGIHQNVPVQPVVIKKVSVLAE